VNHSGAFALFSAVTLTVFWHLNRCEFINFDDSKYIRANLEVRFGLAWASVAWAFQPGHADSWHPLISPTVSQEGEVDGAAPLPKIRSFSERVSVV